MKYHQGHSFFNAILVALIGCQLTSCGVPSDKVRISGRFEGVDRTDCYVYDTDGQTGALDTLHVKDGKFSADIPLTRPGIITLMLPNFSQVSLIAEPGKELSIKAHAERLAELEVHGTDANDELTEFRLKHAKAKSHERKLATVNFIKTNPGSLASLALFRDYFSEEPNIDKQTVAPLLEAMRKAQGKNAAFASTLRQMEQRMNAAAGTQLPQFALETLDGQVISRDTYAGHPLAIIFTATWASSNTAVLRKVRELEKKPGKEYALLIISLDTDRNKLTEALKRDSISTPVVCDGAAFRSPSVTHFGIRYVPGNLLVDSNGRIAARDVNEQKLEDQLRGLK